MTGGIDGAAAAERLLELEVRTGTLGHRAQRPHRLARDLGTDAVPDRTAMLKLAMATVRPPSCARPPSVPRSG
jgi:hypothetical protein